MQRFAVDTMQGSHIFAMPLDDPRQWLFSARRAEYDKETGCTAAMSVAFQIRKSCLFKQLGISIWNCHCAAPTLYLLHQ
jgi:hypothetical protein